MNMHLLHKGLVQFLKIFLLMGGLPLLHAQLAYHYPLNGTFNESTNSTAPLTPLANAAGQTGVFADLPLPPSSCNGMGVFSGYAYEKNAGLAFDLPPGFITCEYTIQFTWKFDNQVIQGTSPLQTAEDWIRIFTFGYSDESGLELWTEPPNTEAAVYYWHLTPLFPGFPFCVPDFGRLSPNQLRFEDVHRLTFTRNCADDFRVYVDGAYTGGFQDGTQRYIPQAFLNKIIFFRDTVDTSCYPTAFPDETSSGFIKDLTIANHAYSVQMIQDDYTTFCPSVLAVAWTQFEAIPLEGYNELSWQVTPLETIATFVVERQVGKQAFRPLAEITPTPGQRLSTVPFTYHDRAIQSPRLAYRVKAIDKHGRESLSSVQEVQREVSIQLPSNPVGDILEVQVPDHLAGQPMRLFNLQGQQVRSRLLTPGRSALLLHDLPPGLYIIRVGQLTSRIIRQ